jgi:PAS domain S-box-containing protein
MADIVPGGQSYEELMSELAALRTNVGEDITFCLFHKDRDGRMIWVNEACCRFIGRTAEEIIGRTDYQLFPATIAQKYRDDDYRVMSEVKPFRSFETVNHADGRAHFVYVVKVPHRDTAGGINGVLGAFWGSHPRSEVEVRLHESEARLRAIIDHLPVMIAALDDRGRVVFWNRECERLAGYTAAEIVGVPDSLSLLYPDKDYLRRMIEAHEQGKGPKRDWEWSLTCKDGSVRTVAWSDVSDSCPVAGWSSWAIGVDVTERNQAFDVLAAIRAVQDNYIARASADGLFTESLQRLLAATQSEFGFIGELHRGVDGQRFLKINVILNVATDEPTRAFCDKHGRTGLEVRNFHSLIGAVIAGGEAVIANDPGADPRAVGLPADHPALRSFLGAPLYHNDQLLGMVGLANRPGGYLHRSIRSITPLLSTSAAMIYYDRLERERQRQEEERRRLESQLQYAQKLESLGVLAGGIAHDFNNLLVSILGHASLAGEDLSLTSPASDSLKQIEVAALRAADLCKQMLAYSGKGHFVIRRINLSALVEEMTHLMQISISKKIVLRQNLTKDLSPIEADATQIRQVLMNLMTNASEACGDSSGLITISTGRMRIDREYLATILFDGGLSEGDYVYLEVSDTGCGMDESTRARIFDPFFTTKTMGRGLGMAAVLGIVRGHRGAIKCYSEVGRGTTFKILFPAATGQAEPLQEKKAAATIRGSGTILVVDDEEGVRALAQRSLERIGFKVLIARDGREGVEVYKLFQSEIVLVLLDMTMPELTGDEVFREMRKLREDVRVILSSGYNEQEATNRFVGKGLAGFIQKPYRPSELAEMIARVLAEP